MQKHLRENGNIIYGDINKQINFKCDFKGQNNIVFFVGGSRNVDITFRNNDGLVFIGNNVTTSGKINISSNGICFIDDNSTFNVTSIHVYESKNIIFGRDCMFSWGIWLATCDHHLIIDSMSNYRINFSKSIYIGDHVWCGQETSILKGAFIASGAIAGAKSCITSKIHNSNTINAGMPSKEVKQNIFWLRDDPVVGRWTQEQTKQNAHKEINDFKYTYDKSQFLSPKAIEKKLDSLTTANEKLEFLYDALYCNNNKNRFAYFKDCEYDIPLPSYEKKFQYLTFETITSKPIIQQSEIKANTQEPQATKISLDSLKQELASKTQKLTQTKNQLDSVQKELNLKNQELSLKNQQLNSKTKELNFTLRYGTAKDRIHNHLSYKLGQAMIENSKSLLGYIRMPYVLSYIKDKHKQEQQQYQEAIKKNPNLKLPNLESYPDYKESLKEKECLTYKLGEAFIKANTAGGGAQLFKLPLAYFNFAKEVRKLRSNYKNNLKGKK
ncbi:hypothetical protein NCR96_05355 [Helicobacter sp. 14348-15]|uniref:hypothetical protein n=1 Tax=Helicobacter colisuis TaxID=2949739 RepID=UPI00202ACE04|nr:hypothetical protein [Helicobacter colisuis]MCL9821163.1 hypothetical protein [Helicobacter colisuis]